MKVIICGATGMIGQALVRALQASCDLTVVGRDSRKLGAVFGKDATSLTWDQISLKTLAESDVVINLAGENIGSKRWSDRQKQKIINSRINTTEKLAKLCAELAEKSPCLMNASAISVYGFQKTTEKQNNFVYSEDSKIPESSPEFLSSVAASWEAALSSAKSAGVRVINLRFSVVLSKDDGALAKMLPSFKLGIGAVLGSGLQPFCWVALSDVVRTIQFLMRSPGAEGPYNIVSEYIYSQENFANLIAKRLNRPRFLRLPKKIIQFLFGQMGEELLLSGQNVEAKRLQNLGFKFNVSDPSDCV